MQPLRHLGLPNLANAFQKLTFNFFKIHITMLKSLKLFLLPLVAMTALIIACNKTDDTTTATVDEAIDQSLYSIQERGGLGKFGCYELVFPVTITLPDSSTVEVSSYDELKTALRTWFEENGTPQQNHNGHNHNHHNHVRPNINFVFPISVISQDGAVITVNTAEELLALREECGGSTFGNHGWQGHGNHGLSCFDLVFPITIQFPDSTTAEATDRPNMRDLIHTWRENNPGVTGRPQIVFPITVQMTDDSTLVTVNSKEELHQLKEDCE